MNIKKTMNSVGLALDFNKPIIYEYEQILSGKKRRFEDGTWHKPNAKDYAVLVIRYLFEEKLNFDFEDILNLRSYDFKTKWKLNGLFKYVFGGSFQDAMLEIYGKWINPWEFHQSTRYKHSDEQIEEWLMDFAEDHLNFESKEELINFFSTENLRKNHGKVFNYFEGSPYRVYQYFYPLGEIRPYEFKFGHNNLWEDKKVVNEFLEKLFEETQIRTKEEFVNFVQSKSFRNKMKGLYDYFNFSTWNLYQYLKNENIIQFNLSLFELNVLPNGFYKSDINKKKALEWLIFEKLKISSKEEYIKEISTKTLEKYLRGLGAYLTDNGKLYEFINKYKIVPWEVLPWEYKHRPSSLWDDKEMIKKAIIWFFEVYLKQGYDEVNVNSFKVKDIWDARLKELYQPHFSQKYTNPKEIWVETYKNNKK